MNTVSTGQLRIIIEIIPNLQFFVVKLIYNGSVSRHTHIGRFFLYFDGQR